MKRRSHLPVSACLGLLLASTALVTFGPAWGQSSATSGTSIETQPTDTPTAPQTPPAPPVTPGDTASNPDATSQTAVTPPPAGETSTRASQFDGKYDFTNQSQLSQSGSFSAEELIGLGVQNASGDSIATVSDIVIDRNGAAKKIVLSEGGVLGVGARLVAVPVEAVKPVIVNTIFDHARLEQPALLPLTRQREFRYEVAAATGAPSSTPSNAAGTAPMTGYDTLAADEFSADRLIDTEICNDKGETIATIEDILFTPDNKAGECILSVGTFLKVPAKHVALNFQDLQLTQSGAQPQIVLAIPREQLEAAPSVTARANGTWGNL